MPERFPQPYVDHRILTLHGVDPRRLNDLPFFVQTFNDMLRNDLRVDLIGDFQVHQFTPSEQGIGDGISGVAIIGASHEAIHSWPELEHLRANFEFCSRQPELEHLDQHLLERFHPEAMESEQSITYPTGVNFLKYAAYSRTLKRTASGLVIYNGARSVSRGLPETAKLLHQLRDPDAPPQLGRVVHAPVLFELAVKEAA